MSDNVLTSPRLTLRPWTGDDAPAAFEIYGRDEVARWLSPAMRQVPDVAAMACVLDAWAAESVRMVEPLGRWAVENTDEQVVVGGAALLPLPPGGEDVEIAWQVSPAHQRRGYATEAARTLLTWAFEQHLPEVFAVSRPGNHAARGVIDRLGMEWVGETEKYYGLNLAVHRLRPSDFQA